MAMRTAQVEIIQQMLESGTKVTAVVEPVSSLCSNICASCICASCIIYTMLHQQRVN